MESQESLLALKRQARRLAREERAAIRKDARRDEYLDAMTERLLDGVDFPARCPVSGYWPMGDEVDPRKALTRLAAAGHPLCLPVVTAPGTALLFRSWHLGDPLEAGVFGTSVPLTDAPALTPRALLVPLLAFDRQGFRLGYGGGFYDRTLTLLRSQGPCTAIGLAYRGQEVPAVPHDAHDQRLDFIVTESEVFRFEGAAP